MHTNLVPLAVCDIYSACCISISESLREQHRQQVELRRQARQKELELARIERRDRQQARLAERLQAQKHWREEHLNWEERAEAHRAHQKLLQQEKEQELVSYWLKSLVGKVVLDLLLHYNYTMCVCFVFLHFSGYTIDAYRSYVNINCSDISICLLSCLLCLPRIHGLVHCLHTCL